MKGILWIISTRGPQDGILGILDQRKEEGEIRLNIGHRMMIVRLYIIKLTRLWISIFLKVVLIIIIIILRK